MDRVAAGPDASTHPPNSFTPKLVQIFFAHRHWLVPAVSTPVIFMIFSSLNNHYPPYSLFEENPYRFLILGSFLWGVGVGSVFPAQQRLGDFFRTWVTCAVLSLVFTLAGSWCAIQVIQAMLENEGGPIDWFLYDISILDFPVFGFVLGFSLGAGPKGVLCIAKSGKALLWFLAFAFVAPMLLQAFSALGPLIFVNIGLLWALAGAHALRCMNGTHNVVPEAGGGPRHKISAMPENLRFHLKIWGGTYLLNVGIFFAYIVYTWVEMASASHTASFGISFYDIFQMFIACFIWPLASALLPLNYFSHFPMFRLIVIPLGVGLAALICEGIRVRKAWPFLGVSISLCLVWMACTIYAALHMQELFF